MSDTIRMPIVVLRDVAFFPGMKLNFTIIKNDTGKACEEAMGAANRVFVAIQKKKPDPNAEDAYYIVGTVAKIIQINKLPGKGTQMRLEGLRRGRAETIELGSIFAEISYLHEDEIEDSLEESAILSLLKDEYIKYSSTDPKLVVLSKEEAMDCDSTSQLADLFAGYSSLAYEKKMDLLENLNVKERAETLIFYIEDQIQLELLKTELKKKMTEKVNKNQREYLLREQLQAIKSELGEDPESEEEEYKRLLNELNASDEIKDKISREISRLSSLNPGGSEASVERTYVETLLSLPWDNMSEDSNDIKHARTVLEEDHYGLSKVKERVLEFLAVRNLNAKGESPIICLVGPPGTGKTSIARSIARALNKEYVRICLGGVKDEAEIRGHRRTYIGAMPGNIIEGLRQAKVKNPLMLLDEIDKASGNYKGDTSSALLEVLDGEQNANFKDHYIGLPVDLSEVLFIATANSAADIPKPLYDRMEIIEVSSYTANEKFHIAKNYLLKKQYAANGLTTRQINISDSALKTIISGYTKEAGVRELERKIGEICRKAAMEILEKDATKVRVSNKNLKNYLGKEKYHEDPMNKKDEVGIVRGLAWTAVGGTTLSIEVNIMPGTGSLELTGKMGEVMQESAKAGISYIRSIAPDYDIAPEFFKEKDIHIHIPEGAVPKDGPSAGITMATAVLSAITGMPVSRNLAMTGEITLRGRVLAIGGLKEKTLAAKTAGIRKMIVPLENKADIEELDKEITDDMEFVFVSSMSQVIDTVFKKEK